MRCFRCKRTINEDDDYASLVSYSNGEVTNKDNWHSICWREWLEEKMDLKVKEYANKLMKISVPLVEQNIGNI